MAQKCVCFFPPRAAIICGIEMCFVCMHFVDYFELAASFRVAEQMCIYLLHFYQHCINGAARLSVCARATDRHRDSPVKNLDDVPFGFCNKHYMLISKCVSRLIAIVSMITCNNESHFMIAPLKFNRCIGMKK